MTSFFEQLETKPADPIFGLNSLFLADPRKDKVNLIIGVCVEEDGSSPKVWNVVKNAERKLIEEQVTKDYLPIDGDKIFNERTARLVLGDSLYDQTVDRIFTAQTPGGTVAIRIILEFNQRNLSGDLAVSDPTWANHVTIANYLGMNLLYYPYYDKKQHRICFKDSIDFFEKLKPRTMVLLQAESHNPSGMNFSLDQWKILAEVFKRRKLIPLFDIAYQGYGIDTETDVASVRLFVREGIECFIAYSYSKNFGIYSERVGALMVVANDSSYKAAISSQIKAMIRANYSNPPRHGGAIISMVLDSPELKAQWVKELNAMAENIRRKRKALSDVFAIKSGEKDYSFIKEANGFFSLLHLNLDQVTRLREEHAVYVTAAARINIAGVNSLNIEKIVDSVLKVL